MPHLQIILHCVWSTKNRLPLLANPQHRNELHKHILTTARKRKVWVDHIGGIEDHIHCLLFLGPEKTISTVMREIKGEASHWYNQQGIGKLEWQDSYFAVSVSPERVDAVRNYIRNQEKHHQHKTFAQEYDEFLKLSGIEKNWIKINKDGDE